MEKFLNYVKAAATNHWNLLMLGGGLAFAFLLPGTSITLPILAALELGYLATVVYNPRFQRVVDGQIALADNEQLQKQTKARIDTLYNSLSYKDQEVFDDLCEQCQVFSDDHDVSTNHISSMHRQSVNHLIWLFLKLLNAKNGLDNFLNNVSLVTLVKKRDDVQKRLVKLDDDVSDKIRHTLEDTFATWEMRIKNYEKAQENRQYIDLELERISTKLKALAEMAVNRQDPSMITSGVDVAAQSVKFTEQALSDFGAITGISMIEDEVIPDFIMPSRSAITE